MSPDGTPRASRLRILHICETYPPLYGGGAALYVQDLCQYLAARGHEVTVLTGEDVPRDELSLRADADGAVRLLRYAVPTFARRDPEGWGLSVPRWRSYQRRVAELLDSVVTECRPDLVNYHATRPLGEEPLSFVSRKGIPLAAMLHEAWLICGRVMLLRSPQGTACAGPRIARCLECMYSHYDGSHALVLAKAPWRAVRLGWAPAYRLWRRRVARAGLDGAVAYSKFMAAVHAPHVRGPVRYVNLGVNLAGVPRGRPARPREPLRFGFFGGFQPNKGLLSLLDAAEALKGEGLSFEIRVFGPQQEGGEREILKRSLEGRVLLRGMYTAQTLWSAYAEIDVAVMVTQVAEPFGRILQEAAAAGAPSIAPAVGGLTEQIRHDVDGLLFRFLDAGDLRKQMRAVLKDRQLLPRLIANLPVVADTREAAAGVEAFYYELLDIYHQEGTRHRGQTQQRVEGCS